MNNSMLKRENKKTESNSKVKMIKVSKLKRYNTLKVTDPLLEDD